MDLLNLDKIRKARALNILASYKTSASELIDSANSSAALINKALEAKSITQNEYQKAFEQLDLIIEKSELAIKPIRTGSEGSFKYEYNDIQKGGKGMVGEIREWSGKKYKKQASGKWVEVSDKGMTQKEHSSKVKELKEQARNPKGSGFKYDSKHPSWKTAEEHYEAGSKLSDKEHSDEEVGLGDKKIEHLGERKNGLKEGKWVRKENGKITHIAEFKAGKVQRGSYEDDEQQEEVGLGGSKPSEVLYGAKREEEWSKLKKDFADGKINEQQFDVKTGKFKQAIYTEVRVEAIKLGHSEKSAEALARKQANGIIEETGIGDKKDSSHGKEAERGIQYKLNDIIREEVGDYTDAEIESITDQLEEAGISDREIKINHASSPEDRSRKILKKVDELQDELRPGLEHKNLKEENIRDILYGLVSAKSFYNLEKSENPFSEFEPSQTPLQELIDIAKGLDTSKLVKKPVQIRTKTGKVFTAMRWVDPNTGQMVKTPADFQSTSTRSKDIASTKTDAELISLIDKIADSKEPEKQKVKDLISLGLLNRHDILEVVPTAQYYHVRNAFKELGIDMNDFVNKEKKANSTGTPQVATITDEEGNEVVVEAKIDLDQMKPKERERYLRDKKKERAAAFNITVDDRWQMYNDTIDSVIQRGYPNSLIAYGTGGVGKTYDLDVRMKANNLRVFDEEIHSPDRPEEYDVVVIKGTTGIRGLWRHIYQNTDKLLVFDDCDSIWEPNQENAQNILKGILDTTGDRKVNNENAQKDQPKMVKFRGQCIFISNLKRTDFPQPLIDSRCGSIDLTMTKDETIQKLEKIRDKMVAKDKAGEEIPVSVESRQAIIDFLKENKDEIDIGLFNGRKFAQAMVSYEYSSPAQKQKLLYLQFNLA